MTKLGYSLNFEWSQLTRLMTGFVYFGLEVNEIV